MVTTCKRFDGLRWVLKTGDKIGVVAASPYRSRIYKRCKRLALRSRFPWSKRCKQSQGATNRERPEQPPTRTQGLRFSSAGDNILPVPQTAPQLSAFSPCGIPCAARAALSSPAAKQNDRNAPPSEGPPLTGESWWF